MVTSFKVLDIKETVPHNMRKLFPNVGGLFAKSVLWLTQVGRFSDLGRLGARLKDHVFGCLSKGPSNSKNLFDGGQKDEQL